MNPNGKSFHHIFFKKQVIAGSVLSIVLLFALVLTSRDIGFVRDEGYYFKASGDYLAWFSSIADLMGTKRWKQPFSDQEITRQWSYNSEHPALVKEMQALTFWLFKRKLNLFNNSTSFRLGSMLFSIVLCLALFGLGSRIYNTRVGIMAVILLFTMPRVFFHAHLACFDVPITAMTVLVAYAYYRARKEPRWVLYTGIFFGLAVATKHNGWFLLPTLALWWLIEGGIIQRKGTGRFSLPPVPLALISMALLGPIIFLAHWPWLWHHTWERIVGYFSFHLHHVSYPVEYFGKILSKPPFPFSFPFVMSALTVPALTLFLALLGVLFVCIRFFEHFSPRPHATYLMREQESKELAGGFFIILNCIVPFLIIAVPSIPIFGGVKHWLPAMPFLALLAAKGMDMLFRAAMAMLSRPGKKMMASAYILMGGLAAMPAVIGTWLYLDNGTAFYNEIAGGAKGGAELGMMRQFWGYASMQAMPWLNRNATKGARVHFHNTNWDSVRMYKRDNLLRKDIKQADKLENADYFLFHNQAPMLADEYHCWSSFRTEKPVFGVYKEEAPILVVYKRTEKPN
ncbi:MAG: phospholipid carrier-dependent glycosyltransferase [Deltaproteobacteria bacterium]|nr:phospholipid carrier-dependent glycosyltransferase [Deltaproteobacteria bacterium]